MAWGDTPLSTNWPKLRNTILKRDGHTCQHCGDTATEVDHIINRANGGTDDEHNLQSLCAACHQRKTRMEEQQGKWKRMQAGRMPKEQHPGLK